jgi:hypothetical protein
MDSGSGTFRDPNQPEQTPQPDPAALLTVGDVINTYITRHVQSPTRRQSAQKTILWHLGVLRRTEIPAAHGQRSASARCETRTRRSRASLGAC